jgi:parvulin-like peptidyl-prolyl isomerase
VNYRNRFLTTVLIAATLLAAQSCKYLFKSDYAALTLADLTALTDTMSDMQKRQLAQQESARKGLLDNFKRAFALAQAAEEAGLDKDAKFTQQMALSTDQLLAMEFGKRNPDVNIPKEEVDAYANAHKTDFENDFKAVNEGRKQAATDEMKEQQRGMWAELKIRAERARKAGLDKDSGVLAQIKFGRANVLANLYANSLQEKFKPTDAERKKYIAEHPEADLEKLKEKAQGILDRIKKGEDFIKLADEFTEDGGRGRGGDLPWFASDGTIADGGGKMDDEFTRATFALQKGEVSKELVKTPFGFHIIRVDDRRMAAPAPAPAAPAGSTTPSATPAPAPAPREEVHARHIIISTQEADSYEQRLIEEKVRRAMEDATLKYPVSAPADFKVNIAGMDPGRIPGVGGGQGGSMKQIQPGENK